MRRFATQTKMAERDDSGDESDFEEQDERVREVTVSDTEDDLEGDDVTSLLRGTVNQLEDALRESRELLLQKDEELERTHEEVEKCRDQVTKEIVKKTKLAQSLDETEQQARELEGILQEWQLELRESVLQRERAEKMLKDEKGKHARTREELDRIKQVLANKEKEGEQLKAQLATLRSSARASLPAVRKVKSEADSDGMDSSRLNFLKQAVYHYLVDYHAEEQVRAIVSMLDFNPEERKRVYSKQQERKS